MLSKVEHCIKVWYLYSHTCLEFSEREKKIYKDFLNIDHARCSISSFYLHRLKLVMLFSTLGCGKYIKQYCKEQISRVCYIKLE